MAKADLGKKCVLLKLLALCLGGIAMEGAVHGQEISDVLNALQDRNSKVEELRKKRFDEWKAVYAVMQAKSNYASPGEVDPGKWKTDLEQAHTAWGNGALSIQDLNNLNEEYGYLYGGLNNLVEDGSVQYLGELVMVPAVQLYHERRPHMSLGQLEPKSE